MPRTMSPEDYLGVLLTKILSIKSQSQLEHQSRTNDGHLQADLHRCHFLNNQQKCSCRTGANCTTELQSCGQEAEYQAIAIATRSGRCTMLAKEILHRYPSPELRCREIYLLF